ncbi:nucleoside/nucleotide kinase family protein [Pedococcus soli]
MDSERTPPARRGEADTLHRPGVVPVHLSPRQIAHEIQALLADLGRRIIVGFAGAPGSGKSTLAAQVCAELGTQAVLVPLDGWHLSAAVTRQLGMADRRGAPETFDAAGFLVLLRRIRTQGEFEGGPTIFAPEYRREIEEPVAGAVAIGPEVPIIVTEGNYLLLDQPIWREVRSLLTLTYYVQLDPSERLRRLVRRHQEYGKSSAAAESWVRSSDEANTRLIEEHRLPPDRVITAI